MRTSLFLLVALLPKLAVGQQADIAVGTWRSHAYYGQVNHLALWNGEVFAAAPFGLFSLDPTANELRTYDKLDELERVDITALATGPEGLVIGYANGLVQAWLPGRSLALFRFLVDSDAAGAKAIRHLSVVGNRVYAAGDFGLLVLQADLRQVVESLSALGSDGSRLAVSDVALTTDSLFLLTPEGIVKNSLSPTVNRQDFSTWRRVSHPASGDWLAIEAYEGDIIAAAPGGTLFGQALVSPVDMKVQGGQVLVAQEDGYLVFSNSMLDYAVSTDAGPLTSALSVNGRAVLGTVANGLIQESTPGSLDEAAIFPNSVLVPAPTAVRFEVGGYTFALAGADSPSQVRSCYFDEGRWLPISPAENLQLVDVTYSAMQQQYYLVSATQGLMRYSLGGTPEAVADEGLDFSSARGVDYSFAEAALVVLLDRPSDNLALQDRIGQWTFQTHGASPSSTVDVLVAEGPQAWLRQSISSGGVYVHSFATAEGRLLNSGFNTGSLPSGLITDLVLNRQGDVWVTSQEGVVFFSAPWRVVPGADVNATRATFQNIFLFGVDPVNCMTVDGGDRKWFGTQSGAFLFSPNTQEQLVHFNTSNSPLPSNRVMDITVNPLNGEVFLTTDQGLVSWRGTATVGGQLHGRVKIFPNPVAANFDGQVAMSGLVQDATVKVTDISGRLVRELRAAGGGVGWDLRDSQGRRPAPGVYLVFSSNDDGTETFVGKVVLN